MKFSGVQFASENEVFLGRRPGKPDRTERQSSSKAGESEVDLDTDADRGQGEASPRFQLSENKIAIPAPGYLMLVSHREVRQ